MTFVARDPSPAGESALTNEPTELERPVLAVDPAEHAEPDGAGAIANTASGIEVDYSLVLAGTVIATFPMLIVLLVLGRQIIGDIMQGAVNG